MIFEASANIAFDLFAVKFEYESEYWKLVNIKEYLNAKGIDRVKELKNEIEKIEIQIETIQKQIK